MVSKPLRGVRPCDGEYVSRKPLCNAWPEPRGAAALEPETAAGIGRAAAEALAPFAAGISPAWLREAVARPCVQRLCVHVQLIDGEMYLVAPRGMRACRDTAREPSEAEHPFANHSACGARARRAQPGVTIPGWWDERLYRTNLEWHFAAGLNLSDCSSRVVPGDHNAQYSRLRLQSALRLLRIAYAALHARGELARPVELLYCANEVPLAFGGWCLRGAQPLWAPTTSAAAPTVPMVQWLVGRGRDLDPAWRDGAAAPAAPAPAAAAAASACGSAHARDARAPRCERFCAQQFAATYCGFCKCAGCAFCAAAAANPLRRAARTPPPPASPPPPVPGAARPAAVAGWAAKAGVAVFRGGAWRLVSYARAWRAEGPRRTPLNRSTWRVAGRTALLAAKQRDPARLNVSLGDTGLRGHSDGLGARLALPAGLAADAAAPSLSLDAQQRAFRYAIHAEGHGGWADRLYKLLAGPQLVLAQDLPARLWYEAALRPYEHYVPVDAALANLTAAVAWAAAHDDAAQAIVLAANRAAREWTSTEAMYECCAAARLERSTRSDTQALLRRYAPLLRYTPSLHARAVRFACEPAYARGETPPRGAVDSCRAPGTPPAGPAVRLHETRCALTAPPSVGGSGGIGGSAPPRRFSTIFEAAVALFGK